MIWRGIGECVPAYTLRNPTVLQFRNRLGGVMWAVFERGRRSPALIGKLCISEIASRRGHAEANALHALGSVAEKLGIPRLLAQLETPTGLLFLQSGVPGVAWPEDVSAERQGQMLLRAEEWLGRFQSLAGTRGTAADALGELIDLCGRQLLDRTPEEQSLLAEAQRVLPEITGMPAVPVHGDFWTGNILEHEGRLGVVDWGTFHYGGATEDLQSFIGGMAFRFHPGITPAEVATQFWNVFFRHSPVSVVARDAASRILARHGIPREKLRPLFIWFLVYQLTRTEALPHQAWRVFTARYIAAGKPAPFCERPRGTGAVAAE